MTIQSSSSTVETEAAGSPAIAGTRIDFLDNLRALAMLLGVFFHASLAYGAKMREFWLVRDSAGSVALDLLVTLSHVFRMGLFFLISGFFANLLIQRRGAAGFVRNRLLRIALPFVIFLPLVTIAILLVFDFMTKYLSELAPLVRLGMEQAANGNPSPPKTTHLWFLYYLTMFCTLALVLQLVRAGWIGRVARSFFASTAHLSYFPLLMVPALLSTYAPIPAPDDFGPKLWSFGYYGMFFLTGWHLFRHPKYLDKLELHAGKLLCAGLAAFMGFVALLPTTPPSLAEMVAGGASLPPLSVRRVADVVLEAYASVYLVLGLLGLGKRFLNAASPWLRYISDASYWIYIVHVPLVLYFQVLLAEKHLGVWLKFFLCSFATLTVSTLSYALFVRYTFIGTMLNGKRVRAARSTGSAVEN